MLKIPLFYIQVNAVVKTGVPASDADQADRPRSSAETMPSGTSIDETKRIVVKMFYSNRKAPKPSRYLTDL